MKFPACILSINFWGTGGTREKLNAVKFSMSVAVVRSGRIGGSVVLDVGSGSCPISGTCCRARDEGMTFGTIGEEWRI